MREPDNIRAVERTRPDWMGFIFCEKSPRHVEHVPSYLPKDCKHVGVFVDATIGYILQRQYEFGLHLIQLHGHEDAEFCIALRRALPHGVQIIKMLPIASADDFANTHGFAGLVDYFLFETKSKDMHGHHLGGSGQKFDWSLLNAYDGTTPFLLAGGISPDDVQHLQHIRHPKLAGFDINSRFETRPAVKDVEAVRQFISAVRTPGAATTSLSLQEHQ